MSHFTSKLLLLVVLRLYLKLMMVLLILLRYQKELEAPQLMQEVPMPEQVLFSLVKVQTLHLDLPHPQGLTFLLLPAEAEADAEEQIFVS